MEFGKTLNEISRGDFLEKYVWEILKPNLANIARDRHAKGCHIRFIGFGNLFVEKFRDLVLSDGVACYIDCQADDDPRYPYGLLYWDADGINLAAPKKFSSVSDRWLEISLSASGKVDIKERKLNRMRSTLAATFCTYIFK